MTEAVIISQGGFQAVMKPEDALLRKQELAEFVKSTMQEKVDFDVLPGTEKPTLLQPGADKLCNYYGLTSETEVTQRVVDHANDYIQFDYTCCIFWHRPGADGSFYKQLIAKREGSCNSKEVKYRWRFVKEEDLTASQRELKEAGKLEKQGRPDWVIEFKLKENPELQAKCAAEKWKMEPRKSAKTGKFFNWYLNPHSVMWRVPNDAVFDLLNTIMKMSQKRAYVAATIAATKAHDLFTQDIEDMAEFNRERREAAAATVEENKEKSTTAAAAAPQAKAGEEDQRPAEERAPEKPKADKKPGDPIVNEQYEKYLATFDKDAAKAKTRAELVELWDAYCAFIKNDALYQSKGWLIRKRDGGRIGGSQ